MDAISLIRNRRETCAEVKIAIVEIHGLVERKLGGNMTLIKGMYFCNLYRFI